jgi:hypothetical protein
MNQMAKKDELGDVILGGDESENRQTERGKGNELGRHPEKKNSATVLLFPAKWHRTNEQAYRVLGGRGDRQRKGGGP